MRIQNYLNLISDIANWKLYFKFKHGLLRNQTSLPLVTRRGLPFNVPIERIFEFKRIFLHRIYFRDFPQPMPTDCSGFVLDVGANLGFFTIFATQHFPKAKIICFEPMADNFGYIKDFLNQCPQIQVTARQACVTAQSGSVEIIYDPKVPLNTAATVLLPNEEQRWKKISRVTCISLGQVFSDHKIKHCDFLKLDCVGAEFQILYQLPSDVFDRIDRIAVEVHRGPAPQDTLPALETYLRDQGYETRQNDTVISAWRPHLMPAPKQKEENVLLKYYRIFTELYSDASE